MAKQPQLPPVTTGPINAVPCCNCGKPNNLSGHGEMLDQNPVFKCDHCGNPFQVARVQLVKFISVRKPVGRISSIKPR